MQKSNRRWIACIRNVSEDHSKIKKMPYEIRSVVGFAEDVAV